VKSWIIFLNIYFLTNFAYGDDYTNQIIVKFKNAPDSIEIKENKTLESIDFNNNLIYVGKKYGVKITFTRKSSGGSSVLTFDKSLSYTEIENMALHFKNEFDVEYAYPNYNVYPM